MLFFYIRHGDPIYTPDSLTELGQKQAEALAPRLAAYGLDKIFSSSSNRAILTAEPTAKMLGLEPTLLDWAHEGHAFRELTVPIDENRKHWGWVVPEMRRKFISPEMSALGNKWYDHPVFEGTTFKSGYQRIANAADEFFASLGYVREGDGVYRVENHTDERVALFAHEGFGLAFLSHVLGIPYPHFSTHFALSHSSMTVIEFKNEGGISIPNALEVSCDSHIYRENLPLCYQNRIFF